MGFISRWTEEYKHEMACRTDDARRSAPDYYEKKYRREAHKRHRIEEEAHHSQELVRRNTQMELANKERLVYERGWHNRGLEEKADRVRILAALASLVYSSFSCRTCLRVFYWRKMPYSSTLA